MGAVHGGRRPGGPHPVAPGQVILDHRQAAEGSPHTVGWVDVRLPADCLADIIEALKGRPFPAAYEPERLALRERTLHALGVL